MKELKKDSIIIFILITLIIILALTLMIIILKTNESINKKVYNAKKEVQKEMLSSGEYELQSEQGNEVVPLSDVTLPKNTIENPQEIGAEVEPKENWNIETVTAISIGNGETIPVPKGFYYVGGDLNTGVIISDDETDKYDGQTDKTTWEYTTSLKGNQFVWIPCEEEQYKKSEIWAGITQRPSGTTKPLGELCYGAWNKATYSSELLQIRKYGGFYVARYEAGLAKTITEFTSTQKHTGLNQVYNKEGIPQAKANQIPWNFIDWKMSQKNAKSMYNTNSISSGLITGTQWDVILKHIVEKTDLTESDLINCSDWGNYANISIEYMGRRAKVYSGEYLTAFGGTESRKTTAYSKNGLEGDLLTTGASKKTEIYHIFDIAGNLYEWTEELSLYHENSSQTDIQYRMARRW